MCCENSPKILESKAPRQLFLLSTWAHTIYTRSFVVENYSRSRLGAVCIHPVLRNLFHYLLFMFIYIISDGTCLSPNFYRIHHKQQFDILYNKLFLYKNIFSIYLCIWQNSTIAVMKQQLSGSALCW
jgi:hypothetical protein